MKIQSLGGKRKPVGGKAYCGGGGGGRSPSSEKTARTGAQPETITEKIDSAGEESLCPSEHPQNQVEFKDKCFMKKKPTYRAFEGRQDIRKVVENGLNGKKEKRQWVKNGKGLL